MVTYRFFYIRFNPYPLPKWFGIPQRGKVIDCCVLGRITLIYGLYKSNLEGFITPHLWGGARRRGYKPAYFLLNALQPNT